jgi:hypothetical protein
MDEDNVTSIDAARPAGKSTSDIAPPPPRFPKSVEEKVIVAKSIVQAVVAAHDSGALNDANYDVSWPLNMVIELLEQAANQIDQERLEVGNG